jgi:hypothetical protein
MLHLCRSVATVKSTVNQRETPMNREKAKDEVDKELTEALEETFPGSDPIAVDAGDGEPVRPADRRSPLIDKELVEKLSEKAKSKNK